MKSAQELTGIWISGIIGGAAALITTQPALAIAKVTGVQLTPTASGFNIVLQTKAGEQPQVFSVNRGNSWTADLVNTQLQLPNGEFQKVNPIEGITSVTVNSLDKNSVRVTVTGNNGTPTGQVVRSKNGDLVLSLARPAAKPSAAKPAAVSAQAVRSLKTANSANTNSATAKSSPSPTALPSLPNTIAQVPALPPSPGVAPVPNGAATPIQPSAPMAPPAASPLPPFQGGTPLVPNPSITVNGTPYASPPPVPPFAPVPLPQAVAPPVGDIAISQTDTSPTVIDLGTAERVPRLVLRDASSREVLSLLARSAGLNLVFTDQTQPQPGQQQQQQGATVGEGPRVTLDIVNEPVQNVFNYVLQVTGLDASRRGNTIFVGTRLPNSARNLVVRSLRLNQVQVSVALPFLVSLGAESAVSRERLVTAVNAVPITNITQAGQGSVGQTQSITQSQTTTEQRIEVQRVEYLDSTPVLRGLQVSGDERTNTVTLVGDSRKIDIAIAQLAQLDVRRRQVAVNVRVIDIDLLSLERLGTSFSFGVDGTQVVNTGGVAVVNFGSRLPAITGLANTPANVGPPTGISGNIASTGAGFTTQFLLQLQAAVTSGNAKILTDPTLVVQEGQQAQVELGEEVITNIQQQTTATEGSTQITVTVEKAVAGLTLPINVTRIDDNGFISLSLAPLISRPQGTQNISFTSQGQTVSNPITLLALRRVQSGQVRLRDGQTLLLSGIIQDDDRSTVTKVPILGDIPILGALFRRTDNQNRRREVIVLLTPRILDDSDRSAFGYSYTPGVETRRVLQQQQR